MHSPAPATESPPGRRSGQEASLRGQQILQCEVGVGYAHTHRHTHTDTHTHTHTHTHTSERRDQTKSGEDSARSVSAGDVGRRRAADERIVASYSLLAAGAAAWQRRCAGAQRDDSEQRDAAHAEQQTQHVPPQGPVCRPDQSHVSNHSQQQQLAMKYPPEALR